MRIFKSGLLSLLANCLKIAASVVLLVLVLEGATRWIKFGLRAKADEDSSRSKLTYVLHPYFQNANTPLKRGDNGATSFGPTLAGWRIHPPGAGLDASGTKLMFLGGSTTANEYPANTRLELAKLQQPVTVYNLAAAWHCSLHSLYKFWTYVDTIDPDVVVVLHNVNDFYRGFTPPTMALPQYRDDYSHHSGALSQFWGVGVSSFEDHPVFGCVPYHGFGRSDPSLRGMFYSLLAESELVEMIAGKPFRIHASEQAHTLPTGVVYPVDDHPGRDEALLRSLPAFRRYMQNLQWACKAKGIPVVFLTMPFTTKGPKRFLPPGGQFFTNDGEHHLTPEEFTRGMQAFNQAVRELADPPHSYVLDFEPVFTEPKLFLDEVHLGGDGRTAQAAALAKLLVDSAILGQRSKAQR